MGKRLTALCLLALLAIFAAHARAQTAPIIGNPIALAQSTTGESSHVFKSTGGTLYSLGATTSAGGWLMAFNTTTAPGNGAVTPVFCAQIAANSTQVYSFPSPLPMNTGITLGFSSTGCFTLTLANAFLQAQVR